MTNKIVITISVCLLIVFQAFAQTTTKYKSSEIYDFSQKIDETAKDIIWAGFNFRDYSRLGNEAGSSFIYFSTEPDNKNDENFFWRLVDDYFLNHSLEENLSINFHEAFHAFQSDPKRKGKKWGAENAMLIFEYQESSARNNALFRIESQLLRSALEVKNKTDLKQKVRQFLAVRRLRQSELEPRFAEFEKGAELNEGMAEYAGTKAVVAGIEAVKEKKISIPFENPDTGEFLSQKYKTLGWITKIGNNIRRKFYYTGSAQGFLLDRLMPDWKTKVQMEGTPVQDLLEISIEKTAPRKEIENILSKYGYERILNEEEKAVTQRKADNQALLEKTLSQKGRKYIIDYSASAKSTGIRNFDPMNVTMISPKMRIHTRSVTFTGTDSFTASFSQPVIEDLENRRYTMVMPENESVKIIVDGIEIDLSKTGKTEFSKSLMITSKNFKFEAFRGKIEIENGEIIINLF